MVGSDPCSLLLPPLAEFPGFLTQEVFICDLRDVADASLSVGTPGEQPADRLHQCLQDLPASGLQVSHGSVPPLEGATDQKCQPCCLLGLSSLRESWLVAPLIGCHTNVGSGKSRISRVSTQLCICQMRTSSGLSVPETYVTLCADQSLWLK